MCKIHRPTKYFNECQTFMVRLDKGLVIVLMLFQISFKMKFTVNLTVCIFTMLYFYLCLDSVRQIVWISWHSFDATKDHLCDIKCIIRYRLIFLCQGLYLLSRWMSYRNISWSRLDFFNRSEIWLPPRQQCCRDACQIAERYDYYNIQSRGFEASWHLAVRRRTA